MDKCNDCKWLNGRVSSIGIECTQPEKQKKWAEKEEGLHRANAQYPRVTARYKQKSAIACKKFERRQ